MLSREVASETAMFEKQHERVDECNVREHANSAKRRRSRAQSSLDEDMMRGQVESYQEQKTALKDVV